MEGVFLRVGLQEEIEGIDDGQVRHQIHFHYEFLDGIGEDGARQVIALRVLLPVQEVRLGFDVQRVAKNGGAAVRRGPETDDLGGELHRPVVDVPGLMMQRNADRHTSVYGPRSGLS